MSITADSQGRIYGKFTIPTNIPAGSKLVEFDGAATEAAATFVGKGTLKIEDLRTVTTTVTKRVLQEDLDPVAQTFVIPVSAAPQEGVLQVAAVDLWFTAKGSSNILIHIRETNLGIPTRTVVAESLKRPADITLNTWTRFRFTPATVEPGREYALVVMCNDAVAEVAIAGVGEFDAAEQRWVTSQPYQIGVLLTSSNGSTWTPHQTQDLAFRLITCDYNVETNVIEEGETTKVVELPDVTVANADHLVVMAAVERPTADCNVVFRVNVNGTIYNVMEAQPFTLDERYSGVITWEAELTGTFTASPVLYKDLHLIAGKRETAGDYVSRAFLTNSGTKLTMYYDVYLPGTSSVTAFYQDDEAAWQALPVVDGTELGDGWQEVKREVVMGQSETLPPETRIKLVLNGNVAQIPVVKAIRVAVI